MLNVFTKSWPLFLGMFMLMIGNGLQGTLLGIRGEIEGFSTIAMSIVMAAYFVGFLFASRMVPNMIQKVGHVRVFAALGSTISAVLILYPALAEPWVWTLGRAIIGFCFCGVYITAESWLNDAASNENRGQALSVYMIVQMAGIVVAQYILTLGDASGFILFIVPSVLVSLAFAPILLTAGGSPKFETTKPLAIRRLIAASPLACMGMFLLGGVFAAQFGMSAVYATRAGLSVPQISVMVSVTYITALVLQYPVGWLSDRMDRRLLIIALAALGGFGALLSFLIPGSYILILLSAGIVGGTSNPLYALLIAYANDYLDREDMAAASGGLLFVNGLGAVTGPLLVGWAMDNINVEAFWAFIAVLMLSLSVYGLWRMTRRATKTPVSDLVSYAPISANASPIMAATAQEIYMEAEEGATNTPRERR
jgi:MFS family permease